MAPGVGLRWKGPLAGREDNVLAAQNRFSDDHLEVNPGFRRSETVVELTCLLPVTGNIAFQPDIQWTHKPGGDPALDDALVAGARITLSF
jgi:carbohydrate-selective porin OprB